MNYDKDFVILANSRKISGRCVAGKEIVNSTPGAWIRPVSSRPHQEINEEERRYNGGTRADLFDIVSVEMKKHVPSHHQSENQLINEGVYWVKKGTADWKQVQRCIDANTGDLWINGHHSYSGINDRVPEIDTRKLNDSLCLIQPNELVLEASVEGASFGNHKKVVRGTFQWKNTKYALRVTDPEIESWCLGSNNSTHSIDNPIICVSLAEESYQDYCYKLIASVLYPKRLTNP